MPDLTPEPSSSPVITYESEVRELCEAVGLTVQAVRTAPTGFLVVTISRTRVPMLKLNARLFEKMSELETRWYSVTHTSVFADSYDELWFKAL